MPHFSKGWWFFSPCLCRYVSERSLFLKQAECSSATSELPVLQHSCGSASGDRLTGQERSAGRGRAVPGLCPGKDGSPVCPRALEESSALGTALSKARLLFQLLSRTRGAHPERRIHPTASPAPPPQADTWLQTRDRAHPPAPLTNSFANKQQSLSPGVLAQEVPPCTEQCDGCSHLLPDHLGDSHVNSCHLLFAPRLQKCRIAFPSPLLSCLPQFPLTRV